MDKPYMSDYYNSNIKHRNLSIYMLGSLSYSRSTNVALK